MLIILLVSAVTLPSIISAISHRQVSEAARVLQAALVGARDSAIHNNAISGIRLLPDPTINGINANGLLDPTLPLAMNRIVPLEAAPDYDEGKISIIKDRGLPVRGRPGLSLPFGPQPPDTGAVHVGADGRGVPCRYDDQYEHLHSERADLVVLEHPDRRQDPDQ